MNSRLKKDTKDFLNKFYKFKRVPLDTPSKFALAGTIDIIDETGEYWDSYKIAITFDENRYPNVIPTVIELSENIERNWDFHISDEGSCCLDIPHRLIKLKRRGIILTSFYKDIIYPFFANHQYKLSKGEYANGEYKHHEKGIIQFYEEEFSLVDNEIIIKHIKLAIGEIKALPNKECPVCRQPKYKKCCRPISEKLSIYGKNQLKSDLEIFQRQLETTVQ